ncbi:NmrA/HSCARG family protein [Actinoplanes sp. TBRC 11911]|uniref:NmrA/HSCARG family protein n=1 Tax=Actinoplanes sp. TBRC 11911 TaxID=2729386 RepID=UPI00145D9ADA|nr:NmrA/HSCARG family protein [Actinoplanes sp. TBRC 11911]NMO52326.1 NmrA/HSCARG family protein [Actinoplanes sp. TBRC 11911]
MTERKIISVLGATGVQGGSVVRALLADGEFAVRAITRAADSAKDLADLGAEIVVADLYDTGSLRRVFDGAYGIYMVTPFFNHLSPAKELEEVRNLIAAAKETGPRHVIWSTLEDSREDIPDDYHRLPKFDDGYNVPHFDVKGGVADRLFAESGLPTTYLRLSNYFSNLLLFDPPIRKADGSIIVPLPIGDATMSSMAPEDVGKAVAAIFRRPAETIGHTLGLSGQYLTGKDIAEAFSEVLGVPVTYEPLSHDEYRKLDFASAKEMGNMFQYYADFAHKILPRRDRELTRSLVPNPITLKEYLTRHRADIKIG